MHSQWIHLQNIRTSSFEFQNSAIFDLSFSQRTELSCWGNTSTLRLKNSGESCIILNVFAQCKLYSSWAHS